MAEQGRTLDKVYVRRQSVTFAGHREHGDGKGHNLPHKLRDKDATLNMKADL